MFSGMECCSVFTWTRPVPGPAARGTSAEPREPSSSLSYARPLVGLLHSSSISLALFGPSSGGDTLYSSMIRPIFSLRPYIASSHHRLTALPYRRVAVRPIVHRSIIQRRRLNSSLAADRSTERQGLDEREAAILHAQHSPPSQSELGMLLHLWL